MMEKVIVAVDVVLAVVQLLLGYWMMEFRSLKKDMERKAEELVHQKFLQKEVEIDAARKLLGSQIAHAIGRLEKGDSTFEDLKKQLHEMELRLVRSISEMGKQVATRDELSKVHERINGIEKACVTREECDRRKCS